MAELEGSRALIWLPGLVRSAGHALGPAREEAARSRWEAVGGTTGSGHGGLPVGATDATTLSRADPSHMASISAQFCTCLPWLLFYCLGSVLGYKDTALNEKRSMSLSS